MQVARVTIDLMRPVPVAAPAGAEDVVGTGIGRMQQAHREVRLAGRAAGDGPDHLLGGAGPGVIDEQERLVRGVGHGRTKGWAMFRA